MKEISKDKVRRLSVQKECPLALFHLYVVAYPVQDPSALAR